MRTCRRTRSIGSSIICQCPVSSQPRTRTEGKREVTFVLHLMFYLIEKLYFAILDVRIQYVLYACLTLQNIQNSYYRYVGIYYVNWTGKMTLKFNNEITLELVSVLC
jgi:hypothetical protein